MAVQQVHEKNNGIPPQNILQVALVCLGQIQIMGQRIRNEVCTKTLDCRF